MSVNISYMGTKKDLAPIVAEVIDQAQAGIMLDAFSGMCSVGEAVGVKRQVWANDIQVFSSEVATALFTSQDEPPRPTYIADILFDEFEKKCHILTIPFRCSLEAEERLLGCDNFETFTRIRMNLTEALNNDIERFPKNPSNQNLFVTTYADSFFGVSQAIEIDAIIYSIDNSRKIGSITVDQRRWLIISLGRALLKVANSTGHFAQFLKPKQSTFKNFIKLRKRKLWAEWLSSTEEMSAVGSFEWRKNNKTFNQDCLNLLPQIARSFPRPSVIYADPPYTDDQYSRYYHLLETLVLYDYPSVTSAGLYRSDRFRSPFSIKTQAISSLDKLIGDTAAVGADLVLSYPTNGLVYEAGGNPDDLLRKYFRKVERCCAVPYSHSTFGASKGAARASVTEQIYLARGHNV
jgi:adenine-specific DNA-methyltransferase